MLRILIALPLLLAAGAAAAQPGLTPEEAALKAHVVFLASDAMRGREAGTSEYDRAARYVADQMKAAGLKPAGSDGGYLQKVPLVSSQASEPGTMTVTRNGHTVPLIFGKDFITSTNKAEPDFARTGEVVFVGYGVVDPASGIDDYRGLDVSGKIVAALHGAPTGLQSEVRAHYGSSDTKRAIAEERGAAGFITIESTALHSYYPFANIAGTWRSRSMTWTDAAGRPHLVAPRTPGIAFLGFDGAAKLFAGSKLDWMRVLAADRAGQPPPRGPLGVRVSTHQKARVERVDSANVVGLLPGSDPKLKGEFVALSAHLDHIGVEPDGAGDRINNGAMDNAVGVGAMLEAARLFRASGKAPRRGVLFVAVTAEEKGLIGSEYFAHNPSVPKGSIVADVNLDMPILTYRFQDLVAYGADRSSIGPMVAGVAEARGLRLTPDPDPAQGVFVRSDHYSFVQAGIPAVSLDTGPAGPGAKAIEEFLTKHYHQPSDDLSLPFDWTAGRAFVEVNYDIARALADADDRPRWNKGDFFGSLYQGYGAD